MTVLVAWLWQGVALAALTELLIYTVSTQAAARRHRVWWFALAVVLVMPLASVRSWLGEAQVPDALAESIAVGGPAPDAVQAAFVLESPPAALLVFLAAGWALATLVGLARLAMGWVAVRRLAATGVPLGPRERRLTTWNHLRATGRRPSLRVSPDVHGACAVGFCRPTVVVSSDLVRRLNDEQLEHVVLHELAHLERYDDWTTLAERLVLAVVGFHPAVWWMARRIELEMEAACDERVVARTGHAVQYARSLLDVAVLSTRPPGLGALVAPGSAAHMPVLRARVERLSAAARRPRTWMVRVASATCVAALACAGIGVGTVPALVAFASTALAAMPSVASPRIVDGLEPARVASAASLDLAPPIRAAAAPSARRVSAARDEAASQPAVASAADTTSVPVVSATPAETPPAATDEASPARIDDAPAPLFARAIPPSWQAPTSARPRQRSGVPGVNAVRRGATGAASGITRAAQSTAGAFTRFGQTVASSF